MKDGFFTALGTPLDKEGSFIEESFAKHVADQVAAGASGLLAMGTMGIQAAVRQKDIRKVAETAVKAADGKCPVMVGVMDNSIARALDRVDMLKGLELQGIVSTAPFYFAPSQAQLIEYFERLADKSPFPLYIYDQPPVTQVAFTKDTVEKLMQHKNIKGIKSANINLIRALMRSEYKPDDFDILFSGLDVFDNAYVSGIRKNLDGMFACMPEITSKMYQALKAGDAVEGGKQLDNILLLRNTFVKVGVLRGFTYAMNLLGYEGCFSADYENLPDEDGNAKEIVRICMQELEMI